MGVEVAVEVVATMVRTAEVAVWKVAYQRLQ